MCMNALDKSSSKLMGVRQRFPHSPIFEIAKIRRGARITGHEDYGLNRHLRRKELLGCDDGTDGVGAKVVIKVLE